MKRILSFNMKEDASKSFHCDISYIILKEKPSLFFSLLYIEDRFDFKNFNIQYNEENREIFISSKLI